MKTNKIMKIATVCLLLGNAALSNAQVTIGSGSLPRATLDVVASGNYPASIIAPSVDRLYLNTYAHTYSTDQTGAIVYVSTLGGIATGSTANINSVGYYYFTGSVWQAFATTAKFWLPSFDLMWEAGATQTIDLFSVYRQAFLGQSNLRFAASPGFPDTRIVPGHNPNAVATDFFYVVTDWDPTIVDSVVSLNRYGVLEYTFTSTVQAGASGYINIMMIRK